MTDLAAAAVKLWHLKLSVKRKIIMEPTGVQDSRLQLAQKASRSDPIRGWSEGEWLRKTGLTFVCRKIMAETDYLGSCLRPYKIKEVIRNSQLEVSQVNFGWLTCLLYVMRYLAQWLRAVQWMFFSLIFDVVSHSVLVVKLESNGVKSADRWTTDWTERPLPNNFKVHLVAIYYWCSSADAHCDQG